MASAFASPIPPPLHSSPLPDELFLHSTQPDPSFTCEQSIEARSHSRLYQWGVIRRSSHTSPRRQPRDWELLWLAGKRAREATMLGKRGRTRTPLLAQSSLATSNYCSTPFSLHTRYYLQNSGLELGELHSARLIL